MEGIDFGWLMNAMAEPWPPTGPVEAPGWPAIEVGLYRCSAAGAPSGCVRTAGRPACPECAIVEVVRCRS